MRKTSKRNLTLPKLREVLGVTQSEFAALVGISLDTIKSIESGRQRLSDKLAHRIVLVTGVHALSLLDNSGVLLNSQEDRYTRQDYDFWRETINPSSESVARQKFKEIKDWIEVVFLAAAKPRNKLKNRLPSVYTSLVNWLDETRTTFKLAGEIDEILRRREPIQKVRYNVGDLRKYPQLAAAWEFEDSKKLRADEIITFDQKLRLDWNPTGLCPAETKKAQPSAASKATGSKTIR